MTNKSFLHCLTAASAMLPFVAVALDQANLDRVVSKMEQDILELASQVEALYQE